MTSSDLGRRNFTWSAQSKIEEDSTRVVPSLHCRILTEADFYLAWIVQVVISSLILIMAAVNPKSTLEEWAIKDIDDATYGLVAMDVFIYSKLIILSALLAWNQDPLTSLAYTCLVQQGCCKVETAQRNADSLADHYGYCCVFYLDGLSHKTRISKRINVTSRSRSTPYSVDSLMHIFHKK